MKLRSACQAVCVALSGAASSRAETVVASSLEWLTCQADVVVVGRLTRIVTSRGPGSVVYDDCTVAVEEIIKGQVAHRRLVFCFRDLSKESPARAWMMSEQPLLLFLSRSTDHGSEKHLDGMLVPTSRQFPLSVIDLAAPGKEVIIDRQFHVLSAKAAILETCRQTAKALTAHLDRNGMAPGAKVEVVRLEVGPDREAWRSLYNGSGCLLEVPAFMAGRAGKRE
jgi:hypothetical protein